MTMIDQNSISRLGLMDMAINNMLYTWFSMREVPALVKLDWMLVSDERELRFSLAAAYSIQRLTSDHKLICLDSSECECKSGGW